ncbi:MAG: NADH-quinone oxidoreductase subunit, partial [Acidimicrobiaceae bacterium]
MFQDFLHWVFVLPLIMAVSFVLILAFGKKLPRKGSEIGIAAGAICFALALVAGIGWVQHVNDAPHAAQVAATAEATTATGGEAVAPAEEATGNEAEIPVEPITTGQTWFTIAGQDYEVGTLVDGLAVIMLIVVTIISLLVHIYSTDYVNGDRRYTHYFAFLSLFTASMLMLVISRNTVQFITSWELVGLCSFALIGHWWEEKPNSDAALKAFITNRVGDIGLLVGMTTLYFATTEASPDAGRGFDILTINQLANSGATRHLLLLV